MSADDRDDDARAVLDPAEIRSQMSPLLRVLTHWRGRTLGVFVLLACIAWHSAAVDDDSIARLAQFDLYQRLFPRERPEQRLVTVVAIDERSIAEIGQWPWPRTYIAEIIHLIQSAGPLAIGIDILFLEPDRQSPAAALPEDLELGPEVRTFLDGFGDYDALLAEAVGASPSVLALAVTHDRKGLNGPIRGIRAELEDLGLVNRLKRFPGADQSIPAVNRQALGRGIISFIEQKDAIVRKLPLVAQADGRLLPSFALEAYRVATGSDLRIEGDAEEGVTAIRLGDKRIRSLPDGTHFVPFGWSDQRRYVSVAELISNRETLSALENSIVLIGFNGRGLGDFPTTPLQEKVPGVEVHAQAIEAFDQGYFIGRPDWARVLEFALIVAIGGLFIFVVPRVRPRYAAPLVVATLAAVLGAGAALYGASQILVDTAGAAFAGIVVGVAMLLMTLQLATAQRRALAANLQRQREERAFIQGELNAARDIQFNLLPKPEPVHDDDPRYSLAAMLEPARDVGGDLYDFFLIDNDRLFVAVGDVSGKGLPASLFMAIAKALYKSSVMRDLESIEDITYAANNEISRENPDMLFVTLFAGIIDLNSGVMTFCNAGHEPPIVFQPGGDTLEEVDGGGGPPICVMEDFPYMAAERQLTPGDMMLLTTDGIDEAMNETGELFGKERLFGTLRSLPSDADAERMRQTLYDSVKAHADGAPASDDITILGFRWHGPAR